MAADTVAFCHAGEGLGVAQHAVPAPCLSRHFTADAGAAEPPPPPPPGPPSSRCWPTLHQASRCALSMLFRALWARQPPSLRPAVFARASRSSSAASGPQGQPRIMDSLDRRTADRLASGAQASSSGGGSGAVAAGARVAVAQMTSGSSTDANFQTVGRLAQVRSCRGQQGPVEMQAAVPAMCRTIIASPPLLLQSFHSLLDSRMRSLSKPAFTDCLLQDAVSRGCKMLFLPENVSFLGTSFTEASGLWAQAAKLAPLRLGSWQRCMSTQLAGC